MTSVALRQDQGPVDDVCCSEAGIKVLLMTSVALRQG